MFKFFKKNKKETKQLNQNNTNAKAFDLPRATAVDFIDSEFLSQLFPTRTLRSVAKRVQNLSDLVAIYGTVDFIFACISYIANCLRLIQIDVYDPKTNEEASDSQLYKLLTQPNPDMGFSSFMESYGVCKLTTGNFYAEIVKANGRAVALYPLQPHRIKYDLTRQTFIYTTTKQTYYLKPEEVFHVKAYNITDDYYGFPPLATIAENSSILAHITDFLNNYFENGTLISGVLESDATIPDNIYKKIKKIWTELYSGVKNAFRVPILEGGIKFKPLSSHISDTQAMDIDQRIMEKVLAVFHVPPELLGLRTQKANVIQAIRKAFWQDTIMPLANRFEEALNLLIPRIATKSERHLRVKLTYDNVPALRDDKLTLARVTAIVMDRGIMSRNEVREKFFKLPPVEGGDTFLLPLNMMQVDSGRKPENEGLGRPPSTEEGAERSEANKHFETKEFVTTTKDNWLLWHTTYETFLIDQLQYVFSKERDLVWSVLSKKEITKQQLEKELNTVFKETKFEIYKVFNRLAERAYFDYLSNIDKEKLLTSDVPKSIVNFVDKWTDKFSNWISTTTQKHINEHFDNEELTSEQIADKVYKDLTDTLFGNRLLKIARTETTRVLNFVMLIIHKDLDYKYKRWKSLNDIHTRGLHQQLHNIKIPIDDCFEIEGNKFLYPCDLNIDNPELVINCRCRLVFSRT